VPVIIECAKMAAAEGAQIVGLGAMTSVAGDAGITVDQAVDIAVTTGNSYTVATALEGARKAAEMMGVDLAKADVAVVGATGAIGRVCAEIMAEAVGRVTLCVRDQAKGEALAEELRASTRAELRVATELDRVLPEADIVVCVSAAAETLVEPRHLKPGAVVCDVARPRDVSTTVAELRDDVLVIEGGVVQPPGDVDFGMNFGFPPGVCYACMAETALLALDGKFESYSLGRHLERAKVQAISELASYHGFKLAGFRSFERAVDAQDIERIRERAEAKRVAAV
jgi:predicted amino acid dehydrogenase